MLSKRLLTLALGVAASCFALTAEAETISIMFQGNPDWVAAYGDVKQRFEKANPGAEVQLIFVPHDSYYEKVAAAAMAKQLPDVIQIDAPYLANYVWSGYLKPVKGLVSQDILDDMTPSNVAQTLYPVDNDLYAASAVDSSVVLYANRKYLEAIGARIPTGVADAWTRQEFEDNLAKLAKLDGVKWPLDLLRSYGIKTEWATYAYSPILQSMGCDLIDRKTWTATGTLDSDACVAAMTMMQGWVEKGWVVPASAGNNQFFAEGNPAALVWGLAHNFYAQAEPSMGDNVVVLPLPKFGEKSVSPNGTWIWGITTASKAPELAGKFVSFLIKDEGYRHFLEQHTGVPGLKSFAAESPKYAPGGPLAAAYEQATQSAVARPQYPGYPTITTAFQTAVDAIFNDADVKESLQTAAKKIDDDIADNDGYPPFGAKN